jgi:chromosome segregation ATPase
MSMPSTQEEFQKQLSQLFVQAGYKQYVLRGIKEQLSSENDALNTLNQKIEKMDKAFKIFMLQQNSPAPQATEQPEATQTEPANAPAPAETV